MTMSEIGAQPDLPESQSAALPEKINDYLRHTAQGVPIRQLAREMGCHASTVQRRIRKIEAMRDDVLFDTAVAQLATRFGDDTPQHKGKSKMNAPVRQNSPLAVSDEHCEREARRILRRLCEPGAVLAFAADMEKAVIVRETTDGRTVRTAVTDRESAQSMAIRDWLVCVQPGRVSRYKITSTGRAALKQMLAADGAVQGKAVGMAETATPFAGQNCDWNHNDPSGGDEERTTRTRYNVAEAPITVMSRRRDKDGKPFLGPQLVTAAERLREDFELSQMGQRISQNWENFLTNTDRGSFAPANSTGNATDAARARVMNALADLGPGLGDVALRVCCYLEGVEAAEKRLGWSARSGKIVLRIALQRLAAYYQDQTGSDMIG